VVSLGCIHIYRRADVINSHTNFVVSTSYGDEDHQSSAMLYKPHLFPEVYKISVSVCKDIIKLNICLN
jgi:hypothetical protein